MLTNLVDRNIIRGAIAPVGNVVIDPHDYGAKGGAISYRDGVVTGNTTFSTPTYTFTGDDIGKIAFIGGAETTINGVTADGKALLANSVSNGSNKDYLIGWDDTASISNALEAAKRVALTVTAGTSGEAAWSGGMPYGGLVRLRNTGYLVRNTQARYDAGKLGAITVPRRCGFVGVSPSVTHIYVAPGNVGHGVCNEGAVVNNGGWDDIMHLSDFSLYMNGGYQTASCLDGVYFKAAFNNYFKVDNIMLMSNIRVYDSYRDGFYISGRGEGVYFNLLAVWSARYGIFIDGYMDSRFFVCNAGGSRKTGIRINRSAAIHLTNCKSFYSGVSGGSTSEDCANFALLADSYLNGQVVMTGCESQECRGSGFYIKSGLNLLTGCLSSDPSRTALTASGTLPTVRAGFHLAGNSTGYVASWYNIFNGCYVRPSLALNFGNPGASMYSGTHAVYIDDNCKNNKGTIFTFDQNSYDVSKIGGTGTTNSLNGELVIDGVPLPSGWPSAPTITTVVYQPDTSARVTYTAPTSNGGRAVRDYSVQYKLSADSVWSDFVDSMSDSLYIDVTGLTNGSSYDFRVVATNENGKGAYSGTYTYTHSPTAPFQVTGLVVTAGSTKAYLTWTAPINGGSVITDYLIEYKLTSSGSWSTFSHTASTSTSITVTSLTNGSSYDFRVSAINAVGTGTASSTVSVTPLSALATYEDATLLAAFLPAVSGGYTSGDGTYVSSVNDLTGKDYNLTQATGGVQPTINTHTINGSTALGFDGLGQYLSPTTNFTTEMISGDFTLFIVFKVDPEGSTKTNALLSTNNATGVLYARYEYSDIVGKWGGSSDTSVPVADTSTVYIGVLRRSSTSLSLYVNGVKASTSPITAADLSSGTTISIGRVTGGYGQLDGCIGNMLFYTSALPLSKCNSIGAALSTYAGTTWTTMV